MRLYGNDTISVFEAALVDQIADGFKPLVSRVVALLSDVNDSFGPVSLMLVLIVLTIQ